MTDLARLCDPRSPLPSDAPFVGRVCPSPGSIRRSPDARNGAAARAARRPSTTPIPRATCSPCAASSAPGRSASSRERPGGAASSAEDEWHRRTEMLFERLAVSWEIAGLPLDDQKMLLGRYRMADAETQAWVRRTIDRAPRAPHPRARRMSAGLRRRSGSPSGRRADRRSLRARARGAGRGLLAVGRRRGGRGALRAGARRCCPTRPRSSAPPCSTAGHAPDLLATVARHRDAAGCCCSATSTRCRPRRAPAAGARGRAAGRLGHRRHEGRGRALARGDARARRRVPRASPRSRCCSCATRSGGPAASPTRRASPAWTPACASRPAQLGPTASEGVVVRRKAAGDAAGRRARGRRALGLGAGSGRNALLALGRGGAGGRGRARPRGPDRLTAVPTVLRTGDAFNVVPATGELVCDLRADELEAFEAVLEAVPDEVDGVAARRGAGPPLAGDGHPRRPPRRLLERATAALLGRPVVGVARGGASDASHFADDVAAHGRRPRPARRPRPQPGRVRRRRLGRAAPAESRSRSPPRRWLDLTAPARAVATPRWRRNTARRPGRRPGSPTPAGGAGPSR